ncbi:Hsp20/alpha crystallin family protein [soil metagenome]
MQNMTTRRPLNTAGDLFDPRGLRRVFDEAFQGWPSLSGEGNTITSAWLPACDVFESNDSVKIVAEIPGVTPDDVKLTLRSYGAFERSFVLPSTTDPDRIEASYKDGILTITVAKVEKARPRQIAVQAS